MSSYDFDHVKNARELGSLLAYYTFSDKEPDHIETAETLATFYAGLGDSAIFLNSRMHDSDVMEIDQQRRHCDFVLNNFESWALAETYARLKGLPIDRKDVVMPVRLSFKNLNHFSAHLVGEHGDLEKEDFGYLLRNAKSFLYDVPLFYSSIRVQIAMIVSQEPAERGSSQALLLMDADSMAIESEERAAWIHQLGKDSVWIYEQMHANRKSLYLPTQEGRVEAWLGEIGAV